MDKGVSKKELLDRVEKRAAEYELKYHGCGQCTLLALAEEFGLEADSAFKAAGFTGGGTARMGNMCGALLGGMLALGLVAGREKIDGPMYAQPELVDGASGLPKSLELARAFYRRFVQEFGSWVCRDIQTVLYGRSFEMSNPKDYEGFQKAGGYDKCSELVGKTARLAAEIILEMPTNVDTISLLQQKAQEA